MPEQQVDVVVIGAGPAGEVVAGRVGEAGLDVVLVERHLVGGECSYYGCMPSKGLLRPGELVLEIERVPGVRLADPPLDVERVFARRDEIVHELDDSGQLGWLEDRGVRLLRGEAAIDGERRVVVGEDVLAARMAVVVATGTSALIPPIEGLEEAQPWTNREITTGSVVPEHLLVLGGGPIGVEMADAYRSLGARVTVLEAAPRLVPREEEFASEELAEALRERGIELVLGTKVVKVTRNDGRVTVALEEGGPLAGDELLVAIGRRPATDELGLDSVGLEPGESLEVDERMRVKGHDWLYAIGDVNGRALLTHAGKYQARVAAENILDRPARATADGPLSPRVTFTEHQIAAVGHTVESAEQAGLQVRHVDHPVGAVAGASYHGRNAPGTARLVIDESRDVIVGATFTGPDVAELLHAATIAIASQTTIERLWEAIPSFPTRSEVWLRLLEKDEARERQ
jgi:dihydrolipoamide dehydrogenase